MLEGKSIAIKWEWIERFKGLFNIVKLTVTVNKYFVFKYVDDSGCRIKEQVAWILQTAAEKH